MPTGRFGSCVGAINGRLYFVGGAISSCGRTGAVEAYDPTTNSWSTGYASMPTARDTFAAGVVNGVLYAVAGLTGCGPTTNAVEAFDPSVGPFGTWTTMASIPSTRYALCAVGVNGILYVIGGYNGAPMSLVEAFDPVTNTWSPPKSPMPTARYASCVTAVNGIIYVMGGGGVVTGADRVIEVYDSATDTWNPPSVMPLPLMPYPQTYASAVSINGIIYVVGGGDDLGMTQRVQVFNTAAHTWSLAAALPTARGSLAAEVINGTIYAAGGDSGGPTFLNTFESLTPLSAWTYCTAGVTTHGCSPSISGTGVPSVSSNSGFSIAVSNVEGQRQGLIFYGLSGRAATVWTLGSSSFMCVKPPVQRTPVQGSGGTANSCDGAFALDFNAFRVANPSALGQPMYSGQVIDGQAWFRDPGAPGTTNLSNGIEFNLVP